LETGLSMLVNVAANHLATGNEARRFGNGHPNIVPYTTFATADGAMALAVGNDPQFARFCEIAGHPEWSADTRVRKNPHRVRNRAEIEALVAGALALHPTALWIEKLRAAGVPCGAVNGVKDALNDAHTKAREMVIKMAHPTAGQLSILGFPIK